MQDNIYLRLTNTIFKKKQNCIDLESLHFFFLFRKLRRKASDQNLKTITEDNRTTVTESEENDTDDRRRSKRNSSNMLVN